MRKLLLLTPLLLLLSVTASAQNTSVTGQVTDGGGQSWNNGSYNFTYQGATTVIWQGGSLSRTITGTLSSSGAISAVNVPDVNTISPGGSQWRLTVCSATVPQQCFAQNLTITGASQVLTVTPPAISITIPNSPIVPVPFISAYADAEISGAWQGFVYYNSVSASPRVCSVATSGITGPCTAYVAAGGLPAGCTSPASAQFKCSIFIATSSFLNVGAAAQQINLYTAGACDGVGACTGFFTGFIAPPTLVATVGPYQLPGADSPLVNGVLSSNGAAALSWNISVLPISGRWGLLSWDVTNSAVRGTGTFQQNSTTCTTPTNSVATVTSPPVRNCATGITANTTQWSSFANTSDLIVGTAANPTNLRLITVAQASSTATTRFWPATLNDVGGSAIGTADCPAAANMVAIRESSVVPDTNYSLILDKAGTCSTTSIGVAVDAALHRFEIRLNDATQTATGCVDSTCVSATTDYPGTFHPGNAAAGGAGIVLDNTTTTSETMSWNMIFAQSQLQ